MPVSPPRTTTQVVAPWTPLPTGREMQSGLTQTYNPTANPNPQMQLVGADSVPFTINANATLAATSTLTFPNLPHRALANNPLSPLQSSRNNLAVDASSHLLLMVFVQGTPGAPGTLVTAAPQAITQKGTVCPGPFLGSENFITFQAVITVANSPRTQQVHGTVVAHLMMAWAL